MSALPRSDLRLRVASAAVGLPLLFLVLWIGGLVFAAVAVVAALIALREMLDLLRRARTLRGGGSVLLDGVAALVGVAYVVLPFAALISLRLHDDAGLQWTALAFLVTFATDTSAYAVGRAVGHRKLAPSISPGKTWEGAIGGLVGAAAAAAALVALFDGIESRLLPAVALGLGIGVVAQAGDLLESKVKRMADVKDSGRLIPGHGGLFDRLDSLLPVFPLVYYASWVW
ncbi:MAG: phosphatidate cytidylyltransferase [Chloroflexi bacterium]|nr:phosphatidate cytidylyltransferase [Chloroflexota bacterium]